MYSAAVTSEPTEGSGEEAVIPHIRYEEKINCQKFVFKKLNEYVQRREYSNAISYIESMFTNQIVEFEKSVLFRSGFEGEDDD